MKMRRKELGSGSTSLYVIASASLTKAYLVKAYLLKAHPEKCIEELLFISIVSFGLTHFPVFGPTCFLYTIKSHLVSLFSFP